MVGEYSTTENKKKYIQLGFVDPRSPTRKRGCVLAHRFALLCSSGKPPIAGQECSHVCKHKGCITTDHLLWESCAANKSRNNCGACPHNPACIAR